MLQYLRGVLLLSDRLHLSNDCHCLECAGRGVGCIHTWRVRTGRTQGWELKPHLQASCSSRLVRKK